MVNVSLFVTELPFGEEVVGVDARLGILVGSLIAAPVGTTTLVPGHVRDDHSMDEHTSGHGEPDAAIAPMPSATTPS